MLKMAASAAFTHGYALLVGVGADLPVTVQDAQGLHDILVEPGRCAYSPDHVRLLAEAQATRYGILDGLDWLAAHAAGDPQATCLVYFSGHGGLTPEYHLVPYGYKGQDLAHTAVSGTEFTSRLRGIQSKKLLVLLDCCHAGGMAEAKAAGFVKSPLPPELDTVLTAGSGRVVIASSRKDEVSYTGTPYSVFTQSLREGLAGYGAAERDGYAYLADVALYVGRVVPARTRDRQHPILKLAAADNFVVAYYAGGEKSPQPLPDAQTRPVPIEAVDVDLVEGYRRVLRQYQHNLLAVEERMAQFYDQAAVPLDLERTKRGILQKVSEVEATIEQQARSSGAAADRSPELVRVRPRQVEDSGAAPGRSPELVRAQPQQVEGVVGNSILDKLSPPGGTVALDDPFYIERDADTRLKREIARSGTTITIRGPRQTGKSSLLARGLHHAGQNGAQAVYLDMESIDREYLGTPDLLLRYLANFIVHNLGLDASEVERAWRGAFGPKEKLSALMEDYVLPHSAAPVILALDEADLLLQTTFASDFFALMRSWHNRRSYDNRWKNLNLALVISTEPYLLISNVNQSPFNVGLKLYVQDFDEAQVRELNRRHGSPVTEEEMPQLLQLLNGHPYLTRMALYTLIVEQQHWANLMRVAASDQGPFGEHLRYHLQRLRDQPELKQALKDVIRHNQCEDDVARIRLLQAGLLKEMGDGCTYRCDLYRRYFEARL
jgi:hypothetical protein